MTATGATRLPARRAHTVLGTARVFDPPGTTFERTLR